MSAAPESPAPNGKRRVIEDPADDQFLTPTPEQRKKARAAVEELASKKAAAAARLRDPDVEEIPATPRIADKEDGEAEVYFPALEWTPFRGIHPRECQDWYRRWLPCLCCEGGCGYCGSCMNPHGGCNGEHKFQWRGEEVSPDIEKTILALFESKADVIMSVFELIRIP